MGSSIVRLAFHAREVLAPSRTVRWKKRSKIMIFNIRFVKPMEVPAKTLRMDIHWGARPLSLAPFVSLSDPFSMAWRKSLGSQRAKPASYDGHPTLGWECMTQCTHLESKNENWDGVVRSVSYLHSVSTSHPLCWIVDLFCLVCNSRYLRSLSNARAKRTIDGKTLGSLTVARDTTNMRRKQVRAIDKRESIPLKHVNA